MNKDIINLSDSEIENISDTSASSNEENTSNQENIENNNNNNIIDSQNENNLEDESSNKEVKTSEETTSKEENKEVSENSIENENTDNSENKEEIKSSEENLNKDITENENKVNQENTDEKSELEKYKETYDIIFKPFKANGKEIQIKTPEEAVKLMQMGANYTKKMQTLQPHLHVVRMLEKNNLLDTEKLNYLIDLDKKNPEAIKKLLKDSNIDPLMIDMDQKNNYKPNNYSVSQNEVYLKNIIDDYRNDSEAKELFGDIVDNWDDSSKNAIFANPSVMNSLITQYKQGYYSQVVEEINRRRIFGQLNDIPFVEAYIQVGRELDAQNAALSKQNPNQNNVPIDTKAVAPKKTIVDNSSKAKSASIARNSINKNNKVNNLYALSDEDFEKAASLGKY